jgi:hypothetical protein
MAEPVIIVKENPGKLRIEVYDENEVMIDSITCPTIPFNTNDSEVDISGQKFKPKKGGKHGDGVEIKIKSSSR